MIGREERMGFDPVSEVAELMESDRDSGDTRRTQRLAR